MSAAASGPAVLACVGPELLRPLRPSAALDVFRPPRLQLAALIELSGEPQCCVSIARDGERLVGYAVFHPPGELETWGDDRSGEIIELGAVEVDPAYRGGRLAERILEASFAGGRYDATVVFATMYAWHYDLSRTGLGDFQYKRMLERLYRSAGLLPMPTSDPEVRSNPANGLMARIGPDCPVHVMEEFERLRTRPQVYARA